MTIMEDFSGIDFSKLNIYLEGVYVNDKLKYKFLASLDCKMWQRKIFGRFHISDYVTFFLFLNYFFNTNMSRALTIPTINLYKILDN